MMLAQQRWVTGLSIMMQSVIFAAVRAPDGIYKDHPVKVIMRWYRRSTLVSAFDGRPIDDPFTHGGGSFTGPFTEGHARTFGVLYRHGLWSSVTRQPIFDAMREVYLRHTDELPHHFQLHLLHAAQIIGVYHSNLEIRNWWKTFYLMIVNDMHLEPESDEALALRLSDDEGE